MGAKALVALVIFMAILIFAGLLLIGVKLAGNLDGEGPEGFGRVALELPEGCAIAEATAGDKRLVLRLEGLAERGCRQVVILDLESGRELGRIDASPGAVGGAVGGAN